MNINIVRIFLFSLAILMVMPTYAKEEAKELSGISIVGNKEAPKSLFIVPWKSSDLSVETGLTSRLLNERMEAVDKVVFERELDFYSSTEVRE